MVRTLVLVAMLLADSQWLCGMADAQETAPSLSSDEAGFLALLRKNIASGGPPKDGIPAIEKPQYTSAAEADKWLLPEDVVFGIEYAGLVAAYPQRILVWHEIANEMVGDEKISITYCPLTGTAIGFKGGHAKDVLDFWRLRQARQFQSDHVRMDCIVEQLF